MLRYLCTKRIRLPYSAFPCILPVTPISECSSSRINYSSDVLPIFHLCGVLEPVDAVSIVLVHLLFLGSERGGSSGVSGVFLHVGSSIVGRHQCCEGEAEHTVGETNTVTEVVSGLVLSGVDKGRDDTTGVTNGHDDGGSHTLFQTSTDVVGSPRNDDGDQGVHARGGKEETDVVDSWLASSDEHSVADGSDRRESHDDDTSFLDLVGPPTSADGGDGSKDIRRCGQLQSESVIDLTQSCHFFSDNETHELSSSGSVTEIGGQRG